MSRLSLRHVAAQPYAALVAADQALTEGPLPAELRELVRVRASRLNGCAFCVDKHTRAAAAAGATERRLTELAEWSGSAAFGPAERAALAYTDTVTRGSDVSDQLWAELTAQFDEPALGQLVLVVALINAFNRIGVPLRMRPQQPVRQSS